MTTRSTLMLNPLKMLWMRSWVRGRSLGVSRRNMPMIAPMFGSTLMTNTFSSLPTKRAHPLLAGRMPDAGQEQPAAVPANRAEGGGHHARLGGAAGGGEPERVQLWEQGRHARVTVQLACDLRHPVLHDQQG